MTTYKIIVRKISGPPNRQTYTVNGQFGIVTLTTNLIKTVVDVYGEHGKVEARLIDSGEMECEIGWINENKFTPFIHVEFKEVK